MRLDFLDGRSPGLWFALRSRFRALLLLAALGLYVFFLAWYVSPYAGGADSSGYLNSAQLLLHGRLTATARVPAGFPADHFRREAFIPVAFIPGPDSAEMVPTYPLGLPLHYAAVGRWTGLDAAPVVLNILTALAVIALLYRIARDVGVHPRPAAALTALFALSPLTLYYALQPMSDLVATAWTLVAILGAWRSPRHVGWAALAALAVTVAVFVRPANALLLLPVAFGLGLAWRRWLVFAWCGLPGALAWAAFNRHLYGSALATGYGNIADTLRWSYIGPTLAHFAKWIPVVLTPAVALFLLLPAARASVRAKRLLGVWASAFVLFYSAYYFSHETWWYLRFLLPAMPALLIGAALVWQQWPAPALTLALEGSVQTSRRWQSARCLRVPLTTFFFIAALVWQIAWGWHFQVHKIELGERPYREVARWVQQSLPPHAVLVAGQVSGAVFHYSDRPFVQWSEVTPVNYAALNDYLRTNRGELYAGLFNYEEQPAFATHLPGTWQRVQQFGPISIWRRTSLAPSAAARN
ncbi:hypothetical protein K0B96_13025 [Horticoccus luteus]|uniref:Uncharacterized protein n=1 Tax=Horticoccus luteus TaxID=2862869 RepID=A0A8F9XJ28_9BACT|nr:hypothetical protein [Horticoccus luteus]QYM78218.1 hypothetical protein K0B96_13025 [Horticoccus luteus]